MPAFYILPRFACHWSRYWWHWCLQTVQWGRCDCKWMCVTVDMDVNRRPVQWSRCSQNAVHCPPTVSLRSRAMGTRSRTLFMQSSSSFSRYVCSCHHLILVQISVITGSMHAGHTCCLCYLEWFWDFSPRMHNMLHWWRWNLASESAPPWQFSSPITAPVGVRTPKTKSFVSVLLNFSLFWLLVRTAHDKNVCMNLRVILGTIIHHHA